MIKQLVILPLVICATLQLAAQSGLSFYDRAAECYNQGNIDCAREYIEQALEFADQQDKAYAWHFKGYVYKEIFKEKRGTEREEARELAIMAIRKSMELDIPEEYLDVNTEAMRALAASFHNDAFGHLKTFSVQGQSEAKRCYKRFEELHENLYPDSSIAHMKVDFCLYLAQGYGHLADKSEANFDQFSSLALDAFDEALAMDSNNYLATVNKGIYLYNSAVKRIKSIDHKTEIFDLILIQDECATLFKESLPYFQRAYILAPRKKSPLRALIAVHKSLNDSAKAKSYQDLLNELEQAGKLED